MISSLKKRDLIILTPRQTRLPGRHRVRFKRSGHTLAYVHGIETHLIDGATVKVYSREKTLAGSFKFRNRIGMDVVLEALCFYTERHGLNPGAVLSCARVCRVENVMRPYLEATIGHPLHSTP